MSLFNSFTAANRVIDQDLTGLYSSERIHGSWTFETGVGVTTTYKTVWQYTRRATKLYRYVGMDYETARNCFAYKWNYYCRDIKSSEIESGIHSEFTDINAGRVSMANLTMERVGGQMWNVVISVDEIDTRLRVVHVNNPMSLFLNEDMRQYDDN